MAESDSTRLPPDIIVRDFAYEQHDYPPISESSQSTEVFDPEVRESGLVQDYEDQIHSQQPGPVRENIRLYEHISMSSGFLQVPGVSMEEPPMPDQESGPSHHQSASQTNVIHSTKRAAEDDGDARPTKKLRNSHSQGVGKPSNTTSPDLQLVESKNNPGQSVATEDQSTQPAHRSAEESARRQRDLDVYKAVFAVNRYHSHVGRRARAPIMPYLLSGRPAPETPTPAQIELLADYVHSKVVPTAVSESVLKSTAPIRRALVRALEERLEQQHWGIHSAARTELSQVDQENSRLWSRILGYCDPITLISMMGVSRRFRNTLLPKTSAAENIWLQCLTRRFGRELPVKPSSLDWPRYAYLLCNLACQERGCPVDEGSTIYWMANRRFCEACFAKRLLLEFQVQAMLADAGLYKSTNPTIHIPSCWARFVEPSDGGKMILRYRAMAYDSKVMRGYRRCWLKRDVRTFIDNVAKSNEDLASLLKNTAREVEEWSCAVNEMDRNFHAWFTTTERHNLGRSSRVPPRPTSAMSQLRDGESKKIMNTSTEDNEAGLSGNEDVVSRDGAIKNQVSTRDDSQEAKDDHTEFGVDGKDKTGEVVKAEDVDETPRIKDESPLPDSQKEEDDDGASHQPRMSSFTRPADPERAQPSTSAARGARKTGRQPARQLQQPRQPRPTSQPAHQPSAPPPIIGVTRSRSPDPADWVRRLRPRIGRRAVTASARASRSRTSMQSGHVAAESVLPSIESPHTMPANSRQRKQQSRRRRRVPDAVEVARRKTSAG